MGEPQPLTIEPNYVKTFLNDKTPEELWKILIQITNETAIETFEKSCAYQSGRVWGNSHDCENRIMCFYKVSELSKYIIPLGILKKLSLAKTAPNRIFTLSFEDTEIFQSFDKFDIQISEKNLKNRIRYAFIETKKEEDKRKSILTKMKDGTKEISKKLSDESVKISEGFSAVGKNFNEGLNERTNATRSSLANSFQRVSDSMRPNPRPDSGATDGGKRKTIRKNKKKKLSLRKK